MFSKVLASVAAYFVSLPALCKEIAAKTSTVFSLDVSSVTLGGQDQAVREIMEGAGFSVRPNGKVNLGLGRPLHQF